MKIQVHSLKFDADQKLINYIEKKANKLEKYFGRVIDGEVILKLNNDNGNENKTLEFKVNVPGDQLFAKVKSNKFEKATDQAIESLRRQLEKYKEKLSP